MEFIAYPFVTICIHDNFTILLLYCQAIFGEQIVYHEIRTTNNERGLKKPLFCVYSSFVKTGIISVEILIVQIVLNNS